MSPEQAQGAAVDHRTDIWSLAVVFYEMLTGEQPFKGDYEQAVVYSILHEEPEVLPVDIPNEIAQIIERALSKNPDDRHQNLEMLRDLEAAREGLRDGMAKKRRLGRLTRKQRIKLFRSLAATTVLLIALAFYLLRTAAIEARPVSIAILPLTSPTEEVKDEYFTFGMTDALITDMTKIAGLRVIAQSSVMQYKNNPKPIAEIAMELNVEYVIIATIMKQGETVRISPKLIHTQTNEYVWAENYEREMSNILTLQAEIAQAIARQVKVKLRPAEESRFANVREVNPEAHEAYLKGRLQLADRKYWQGIEYFQKAIAIDSLYAAAYTGLCEAYTFESGFGSTISASEAKQKAMLAVSRAIKIDSTLAEAYVAKALLMSDGSDWRRAEQDYKHAITLNPSYAHAHDVYATTFLCLAGRFEEASEELQIALELDPLSKEIMTKQGWPYLYAREHDKAIEKFNKTLEMYPNYFLAHYNLGLAYLHKGLYDEAIAAFKKSNELNLGKKCSMASVFLAYSYAVAGKKKLAGQILDKLSNPELCPKIRKTKLSRVYLGLGQKERALDLLETAYLEHERMVGLIISPVWDSLRSEPRFRALLKKVGWDE